MDKELTLTEMLVQAIQQDRFSQAKSLLEQGANPNQVLPSGISPFHLAIGADTPNALAFVKLLLQYHGNPNVRSVDGMTPVHVAATWGRCQALHLLLVNGGNPELCDEDGANAVDMAKENESWDCLSIMTTIIDQTDDAEDSQSVIRYPIRTRNSWSLHPECSWTCHDSTDLNHDSVHASIDYTCLSSHLQDASLSCSSFSSISSTKNRKSLSKSFFPDLDLKNEVQVGGLCRSSEPGNSIISKLKTRSRTCYFPPQKLRTNLEATDQQPQCVRKSLSVSNQGTGYDFGEKPTRLDVEDFLPITELGREDETDHDDKEVCDRTLSSYYLQEVLMNNICTGLDLTSPDHPAVFIKTHSAHNGDTPPLDKTVVFMPHGIAIRQSAETRQINGCDTDDSEAEADSNISGESSAYVTCQSDDMILSCSKNMHQLNKQMKRPPRRVTFSNDGGEPTNSLLQQSGQAQVTDTCARHVYIESGLDGTQCKLGTQVTGVKSSEQTCEISDMLTADDSELVTSDDSELVTSDEDSCLLICRGPNSSQLENESRHPFDYHDHSNTERRETEKSLTSDTCSCSCSHPFSNLSETLSSRYISHHEDCSKPDCNVEHDSQEYLYHDQDTGAMLIERQCPSACGMRSTHQDISGFDYSHVSSTDETIPYDWRDYQTDDDQDTTTPPFLSKELLQLTNKGIRELMQKYGEEAGPITATTRMVYLHHLAKLQNDPKFATRASSKQQTSQGFHWELADYLNTGQLAESEPKMVVEEQLMVAPFQTPDPVCKWREGTLKSSFNYLLLDPRVTKDLPGRYTQLTQLETFRIFVAAIFYIGKGKRGRPYAHFYEALSVVNPCKEVKGQTPRKATKKQPGAKVCHILDIWAAGLGVVSLHCFQSVIPVEAYTREACMVDAMGLTRLTNIKKGDFYGPSVTLPARKRRQMGVFLLKKACQIFVVEGERQIRPADIALGQ